jgi:hypothetical protein
MIEVSNLYKRFGSIGPKTASKAPRSKLVSPVTILALEDV